MTEENNQIIDYSSLHKYRTETPNIILDMDLDPYEGWLYMHLKRIASDKGGCYATNSFLIAKTNMKITKLNECKKSLEEKGLIKISVRKNEDKSYKSTLIEIIDVWGKNFEHFAKPIDKREKIGGMSSDDRGVCRDTTGGMSSHGIKERTLSKKNIFNKNIKESKPKKKTPSYEQPPNPESNDSLDSKESHDKDSISPEISKIVGLLKRSLKLLKHDYRIRPSDETRWGKEVEKMIRIDKRNPEIIKKILEWLPTDSFWQGVILSGIKLRKQFDVLELKMCESRNQFNQEKYKIFAYKVKKAVANCPLNVSNKGVYDKVNQVELSFVMPYDDFCHTLARAYNISNYEGDM